MARREICRLAAMNLNLFLFGLVFLRYSGLKYRAPVVLCLLSAGVPGLCYHDKRESRAWLGPASYLTPFGLEFLL